LAAANVELKVGGRVMVPSDEVTAAARVRARRRVCAGRRAHSRVGYARMSQVAEHVSPGDDVFVSICEGASAAAPPAAPAPAPEAPPAAASVAATPAAVDAPRAAGDKLAKKLKVYVHYEAAAASKDPTATSVCVVEDTAKSVGEVITEFVAGKCRRALCQRARARGKGGHRLADERLPPFHGGLRTACTQRRATVAEASRAKHSRTHRTPTGYNNKHMGAEGFVPLEPLSLCARTDAQLVVPCEASVAKTFKVFFFLPSCLARRLRLCLITASHLALCLTASLAD